MPKQHLVDLLDNALQQLAQTSHIPTVVPTDIQLTHSRDPQHGDYACNIALILAKAAKTNPRQLAQQIVDALPASKKLKRVEIAGPGFINFYLEQDSNLDIINDILRAGKHYGHCNLGRNQLINLEFVSSNPTGPLHVGHGRGAAYGACVANLLEVIGYQVHREYYVNDAGRQMDILTTSLWLRYLELFGATFAFPSNGYQGDYVVEIAKSARDEFQDTLTASLDAVFNQVPADYDEKTQQGDREAHIDGLVHNARDLLGEVNYHQLAKLGLNSILTDIKQDLAEFGVTFDEWYSEQTLVASGALARGIQQLKDGQYVYQNEGATWFAAAKLGDEKDRVLVRKNGQTTYFTSDMAYHLDKLARGATQLIDVFGADHHGYVPRLKAGLTASGQDPEQLKILMVQFATLYRGKQKVPMSTRKGSFVTLRELRDEVGNDAARFFYILRKSDQHMDFDLELAKSHSNDNPVYYVQYAHARIASLFKQLDIKKMQFDQSVGIEALERLTTSSEHQLIRMLARYSDILVGAAKHYEPHRLANYLRDLATKFHSYYNNDPILVEGDHELCCARLCLCKATQQIIAGGLYLLGVSAPEQM